MKGLNCGHKFCEDCWLGYLESCLTSQSRDPIKCMDSQCKVVMDDVIANSFLKKTNASNSLMQKYHKLVMDSYVEVCSNNFLIQFSPNISYFRIIHWFAGVHLRSVWLQFACLIANTSLCLATVEIASASTALNTLTIRSIANSWNALWILAVMKPKTANGFRRIQKFVRDARPTLRKMEDAIIWWVKTGRQFDFKFLNLSLLFSDLSSV